MARNFTSEHAGRLSDHELAAYADLAASLRAASWDVALHVVETALERDLLPSLASLGTVRRLANLPAFIGGLAMALVRPGSGRRRGLNPILARLARDHVVERERAGFSAREVVQEFLLLRRAMWSFIQEHLDPTLDARGVLQLEDLLNSILDDVIAECTVIYFDRATQELSERSRRDSLTGLLNHQAFNTRLDEELDRCRRYGHELQVIYLDLDEFKLINDTHGHDAGDRALSGVATIVLESIRESDFAGRIGGDEFVIGLVESTDMAAHLLLDRLRARIARASSDGVVPPGTGISAGCAGSPSEADAARDLLVLADRRMYDDKRERRRRRTEVGSAGPAAGARGMPAATRETAIVTASADPTFDPAELEGPEHDPADADPLIMPSPMGVAIDHAARDIALEAALPLAPPPIEGGAPAEPRLDEEGLPPTDSGGAESDTARIVAAARAAIEDARRRSGDDADRQPPGQGS